MEKLADYVSNVVTANQFEIIDTDDALSLRAFYPNAIPLRVPGKHLKNFHVQIESVLDLVAQLRMDPVAFEILRIDSSSLDKACIIKSRLRNAFEIEPRDFPTFIVSLA